MVQPEGELFASIEAYLRSARSSQEENPAGTMDWSKKGQVVQAFIQQHLCQGMVTDAKRIFVGFSVWRKGLMGLGAQIGDLNPDETRSILSEISLEDIFQYTLHMRDEAVEMQVGLSALSNEFTTAKFNEAYYGQLSTIVQSAINFGDGRNR